MNRTRVMAWVGSLAFALLLGSCGGSNSSSATVGGSVNGLAAGTSVTLTLQLTGGPSVTMSSNSSFTFSGSLASTNGYNVTVSKQPTGQTCVVTYGSGTIDYAGDSVTDVKVTCADNVPIGVSVSGLTTSNPVTFNVALQDDPELQNTANTSFPVSATADGTYEFPVLLPLGTVYTVTVADQPTSPTQPTFPVQVCTLDPNSTAPYTGGVVSSTVVIVVSFKCK